MYRPALKPAFSCPSHFHSSLTAVRKRNFLIKVDCHETFDYIVKDFNQYFDMDKLLKLFLILLLLSILIGGIIKWYQLVIQGAYYQNASFIGSALVTLLPAAAAVMIIWLLFKTLKQLKF